jgi:putative copper resistance protein D
VIVLGLLARWAHLASGVTLLGSFALLLLAGRAQKPTAICWDRRVLALARVAAVVALVSGVMGLGVQTAVLEGRAGGAVDPAALARVLTTTQLGTIWLARHGLLALLAAVLFLRGEERTAADWAAFRGQGVLLGGAALLLAAASGHASAVEPTPVLAESIDALHLAAAGVWIGALVPLAFLASMAATPAGADARPHAVIAARRFSAVALGAVVVLVVTGISNTWTQVGGVAALLGTPYGRLLMLKLGLLIGLVALGAVNRRRLVPALAGDGERVGRPAMRRLGWSTSVEAVGAAVLLALVAAMAATPPARHVDPSWPLPFRWSYAAVGDIPGVSTRVFVGSQVALLGVLGAIAMAMQRRARPVVITGVAVAVAGLAVAVPPLTLAAHPTTYRQPGVPYRALSIASGAETYRAACLSCHQPSALDVSTPRAARATAGDLFWWITHGRPPRMPAFGDRLSEEQRWDLVNFLRAVEAGRRAGELETTARPAPPVLVAPDFDYVVGPTPPRALREFRGRRVVLLVFFSLPDSTARLAQLGAAYDSLATSGAEIIAVPLGDATDVLRRLAAAAPESRILYPVVTEDAATIARAYEPFAPDGALGGHVEFLVDRTGYLRWRRTILPGARPDLEPVLTAVLGLAAEPVALVALPEHVH